jgi:crotonobetainyl-CoA:carnitine CoA-transferase CaiB-like acyl-CoA transferase
MEATDPMTATDTLAALWHSTGLPEGALANARLSGSDPVLPSSFAVGEAAQSTIAAAALAATEFGRLRGATRQEISVDMTHAALECVGWFSVDGHSPELFDALSGLYRCNDGWIRLHAVFAHHRAGALRLLRLDPEAAQRAEIEKAVGGWRALELEAAAAEAGLVLTAMRTFDAWDATEQGQAIAAQPLFSMQRLNDAPPLPHSTLDGASSRSRRPLEGVRILDLTRILAGPVGGRTLAGYGADVMLINSPYLPNIEAIAETSRGKLSAHVDLRTPAGRETLHELLNDTHVLIQGYRPGGLARLGFSPTDVAQSHPGIIYVSLSAYGQEGPWSQRRGFDSLVQTAMGFNAAEGEAAGQSQPRALPMQILDHATGYLIAMCVSVALIRQQQQGGSWHVNLSLAQTGHWLRRLGRVQNGFDVTKPSVNPYLETTESGFGKLTALRHSARFSRSPSVWSRPSMPPGSHAAAWPKGKVDGFFSSAAPAGSGVPNESQRPR